MVKNVIIDLEWDTILNLRLAFAFHFSAIKGSMERFIIDKCFVVDLPLQLIQRFRESSCT